MPINSSPVRLSMSASGNSDARRRLQALYRNLTLWTLQGWLAMFFVAAGYAKLSEPMANLIQLMQWPAHVDENIVRGLGIAEVVLAILVIAPLASWRFGRAPMIAAAFALLLLEVVMLGVHLIDLNAGLAITNLMLITITLPLLWLRSRERAC